MGRVKELFGKWPLRVPLIVVLRCIWKNSLLSCGWEDHSPKKDFSQNEGASCNLATNKPEFQAKCWVKLVCSPLCPKSNFWSLFSIQLVQVIIILHISRERHWSKEECVGDRALDPRSDNMCYGSSCLWGKLINCLISLDFSFLICEEKDLNEIHYLKMS